MSDKKFWVFFTVFAIGLVSLVKLNSIYMQTPEMKAAAEWQDSLFHHKLSKEKKLEYESGRDFQIAMFPSQYHNVWSTTREGVEIQYDYSVSLIQHYSNRFRNAPDMTRFDVKTIFMDAVSKTYYKNIKDQKTSTFIVTDGIDTMTFNATPHAK